MRAVLVQEERFGKPLGIRSIEVVRWLHAQGVTTHGSILHFEVFIRYNRSQPTRAWLTADVDRPVQHVFTCALDALRHLHELKCVIARTAYH
jgi:hypothetical protein